MFDVLTQLVRKSHRFVTKEELFDSVWGGRFVGEAALTSGIKAARRALATTASRSATSAPSAAAATNSSLRSSASMRPNRPLRSNTSRSVAPPTVCGWRMRLRGRARRWSGRPTG